MTSKDCWYSRRFERKRTHLRC